MGYKRNKDGVHKKSLGDALENPETHGVRVYPHKKARNQLPQQQEDEEWIDTNQSSKILALAKEQQQEQAREQANAASAADIGVLDLHAKSFCTPDYAVCFLSLLRCRLWCHGPCSCHQWCAGSSQQQ